MVCFISVVFSVVEQKKDGRKYLVCSNVLWRKNGCNSEVPFHNLCYYVFTSFAAL